MEPTTTQKVIRIISDELNTHAIAAHNTLHDLGADSLDITEVAMRREEQFGVALSADEVKGCTVAELSDLIQSKLDRNAQLL